MVLYPFSIHQNHNYTELGYKNYTVTVRFIDTLLLEITLRPGPVIRPDI